MLCNLVFANNAILSIFFFFFLIFDLTYLIPAVIGKKKKFPIAELVTPIWIPSKEAKLEIKLHQ